MVYFGMPSRTLAHFFGDILVILVLQQLKFGIRGFEFVLIFLSKILDTAKKAAMLCPQNVVRRKLADISNLPQGQRLLVQEKSHCIETTTKEYIEQLKKENVNLVKMLAQRNKIIEQSGIELERLRVTLLKMHEQNQQMALSNSQMLAELNTGKDRLRVLQHELGCKSSLLKTIKLEAARTKPCKTDDVELMREDGESFREDIDDEKPRKIKRNLESNGLGPSEQNQSRDKTQNKRPFSRRQSARFKAAEVIPAVDLSETNNRTEVSLSQLPDDKEQSENKRCLVRRQSSRFKAAEIKTAEDMFEANSTEVSTSQLPGNREQTEIKRPCARRQSARLKTAEVNLSEDSTETNGPTVSEAKLPEDTVGELVSTSDSALVKNEGNRVRSTQKFEPQGLGRSSLSRPSRLAAKKVQSYKEIPVNVKMRRPA